VNFLSAHCLRVATSEVISPAGYSYFDPENAHPTRASWPTSIHILSTDVSSFETSYVTLGSGGFKRS